jgi:hypothetical protein
MADQPKNAQVINRQKELNLRIRYNTLGTLTTNLTKGLST